MTCFHGGIDRVMKRSRHTRRLDGRVMEAEDWHKDEQENVEGSWW